MMAEQLSEQLMAASAPDPVKLPPVTLRQLAIRLTPNPALTVDGTLQIILDGVEKLDEELLARTLGYVVAKNPDDFDGSGQGMDVEPMTDEQWAAADPLSKHQLLLTAKAVKIALRMMG
jgi:hypothetical protein